jgi:hypothetical protein
VAASRCQRAVENLALTAQTEGWRAHTAFDEQTGEISVNLQTSPAATPELARAIDLRQCSRSPYDGSAPIGRGGHQARADRKFNPPSAPKPTSPNGPYGEPETAAARPCPANAAAGNRLPVAVAPLAGERLT